jgi:hypothetical protein
MASGASTGFGIGTAAAPFLGPLAPFAPFIGAAAGGLTGLLGSRGPKPTKTQAAQSQLLDQLLASIKGSGPYSDLFQSDEAAFQKSYVDPAKQLFKSQIAPQIQESFVSQGQQGSTGMETALTRAGVGLDQMLNQAMMQFQQQGKQNKMQAMNSILGAAAGPQEQLSPWESMAQGIGGYLSGDSFGQDVKAMSNSFRKPEDVENREGFVPRRQ